MGPAGREPKIFGLKAHRATHYAMETDASIDKNVS